MDNLTCIMAGILSAEFLLEQTISYLNHAKSSEKLPNELSTFYDEEEYARSQRYNSEKHRLGLFSGWLSFIVTLGMLLGGGFAWFDNWVTQYFEDGVLQSLAFFAVLSLASDVISIPFEYYGTFTIEEKYGFNKMKPATFFGDKLKGYLLGGIVGGGLLYLFLWLHNVAGNNFWIYAWCAFMLFAMIMMAFYTSLIVPLFNKLTPLEDGELRQAIERYAEKVDFPLKKIMVVDGSKRSTKANAYFSGIGGSKNIVLYDTLIEKHTTDELMAILAHEVGHYKRKHTLQGLVLTGLNMLLTLYIMHLAIDSPDLSYALGADMPKIHLGLLAFTLLYSPISMVTGVFMNVFSRKNEFEADAYAIDTASGNALVEALKKLSVDNLANLEPHPAYVFFHYSHPPLLIRLKAMMKRMGQTVNK